MDILVCGGAGSIGAHMVKMLVALSTGCAIFDNLSSGLCDAVRWGELVIGDLLEPADIEGGLNSFGLNIIWFGW